MSSPGLSGVVASKRLLALDPLDGTDEGGFDFSLLEGGEVVVNGCDVLVNVVSHRQKNKGVREEKKGI